MPTQGPEAADSRLGWATKAVADRAAALARLELKLALLELKAKLSTLGLGIGLLVGAAVFGLFALGFLLAAAAAGLATTLATWLALLVVGGVLVVVATALVLVGWREVRRATPPVPEQAIEEAKLTTERVRNGGGHGTPA